MVVGVLLVIGSIGVASEPKCIAAGCNNKQASGSSYCYLHKPSSAYTGNSSARSKSSSSSNFLCGKQEKCVNCGIKNYGTPLYPIYYSDTPYDATKFAKFVMLRKIAETTATQIPPELYAGMGSALWEQERTTLIKKECHKYDEEWRMITGCIMKPPVMMEWIPSGIILGLRMGVAEENLVVSMAKEAGIKNIYKSYINAQNKLDTYPLKL